MSFAALSLTHFADALEPQIAAGSLCEIGGALYEFAANESITGWAGIAVSSAVYIKLVAAGASVTAAFTTTAPTWNTTLHGWYSGTDRYIGGLYKDAGGNYIRKSIWNANLNYLPIGTIIEMDGEGWADNCTLPGWYACIVANAAHGCPNLVDRFIQGKVVAGAGALAGSNTHTNTVLEMASHYHDIPIGTASGAGLKVVLTNDYAADAHTTSVGSGNAWDIRPANYTVVFIRKCY